MKPFDNVTVVIVKNDIEYTYGGTIICTFESNGVDMCGVSLLNADGVIYVPQSEVTVI